MFSPTYGLLKLAQQFEEPRSREYWRQSLPEATLRQVEATVAPNLAELDQLRRRTIREIDVWAIALIPVGILIGIAVGLIGSKGSEWKAAWFAFLGAMIACGIAYSGPQRRYRKAYKGHIIPHLTAQFGDLAYREADPQDFERLVELSFLPAYGESRIEDEIYGRHRGVGIHIIEANLETGGKNSRTVFNGLVVELDFPKRFAGTTVVTKDAGWIGAALDAFGPAGLQRVRLEDPRFEARYQVYGSDQIGARALLTPAIMDRIMELDAHAQDQPARLLAEPGKLWVTIPKHEEEDLFEPPPLSEPVTSAGELLAELSHDIGSVLAFVDTVLALDPLHEPAETSGPAA